MLARTAIQICRFHKDRADRYVDGAINIWMSAHALAMLQSLILISAANGAPVLFARLLGARFAHPIDGGIVSRDGHPLLGRSKTWRGLAAAVLLAACAAVLKGEDLHRGSWARIAAASAMAGDCLSSFHQTAVRARAEQYDAPVSIRSLNRCFHAVAGAACYVPLGPLDVALDRKLCVDSPSESWRRRLHTLLLRHRPTGSSLLRDVAHKLVQSVTLRADC